MAKIAPGSIAEKYLNKSGVVSGSIADKYLNRTISNGTKKAIPGSIADKYLKKSLYGYGEQQITPEENKSLFSEVKTALTNYGEAGEKTLEGFIAHPIKSIKSAGSAFVKTISETWKTAVEAGNKQITIAADKPKESTQALADILHAIGADAQVLFSPISASFSAAEKLPVLREASTVLAAPFAVAGKIGEFSSSKFIDVLPISQESKDVLRPSFQEVGSLAGQVLLGGKLMKYIEGEKSYYPSSGKTYEEFTADWKGGKMTIGDKIIKRMVKETKTEVEKAKQVAIEQKTTTPIKQEVPIQQPIETVKPIEIKTPSTKVSKASSDINKVITQHGIEELPPEQLATFNSITKADQINKVSRLLDSDYEIAKKMALGKEPTGDMAPQVVFNAVKNKAWLDGDYNLLRDLADSPIAKERALLAQQLGSAGYNNWDMGDPVAAMREISKARESALKNAPREKIKIVDAIKSEIKKVLPRGDEWGEFIKSLECK